MDKLDKALQKLRPKEKEMFKRLLSDIRAGALSGYDLKKLKGRDDIYRIRKGGIRVIFCKTNNSFKILSLERRGDTTYAKH